MEAGHGLQIVNVTDAHEYSLDEKELEQLLLREDVKDLPVVVVSVAGAYRGGKSFLLNFFLRYLTSPLSAREDGSWLGEDSAPLAGFTWRSGIKATTMGILMWSEPFITSLPSGEKVVILLVDTQGTFDNRSTVRDNSTVFALSTLVSSVQIYNLSHDIKEDDLQHLELFTEYGKLVNPDSNKKAFQVLEFLVRDWQFPDKDHPYGAVGGERLLQEKLEITEDLPQEMKDLREHIRLSFEKVSCFLMPHPGFAVLRKSFKGNINDIDVEFRTQLKDFTNSIFGPEKLLPKTINGDRVKARDLFNYFKTYMELFNSDEIPNPTNILVATVTAGLLSAASEARDIYEKGMANECGPNQLSVPSSDLRFLHEKYLALACASYNNKKKMGTEKKNVEYLNKLTKDLNDRLPQFLQSNLSKTQTAMDKAKVAYNDVFKNNSNDELLCLHEKDLERFHKSGVEAAIKVYDAARKRVMDTNDVERAAFIQGFDQQYAVHQRINKQNNDLKIADLTREYWLRMQAKTALDPPLSEAQYREEHYSAKDKALRDFDSARHTPADYDDDNYKFKLETNIIDKFNDLRDINNYKILQVELIKAQERRRRIEQERREEERRQAEAERRRREWSAEQRRKNSSSCSFL